MTGVAEMAIPQVQHGSIWQVLDKHLGQRLLFLILVKLDASPPVLAQLSIAALLRCYDSDIDGHRTSFGHLCSYRYNVQDYLWDR